MGIQSKQLGQVLAAAGATPEALYSPASGITAVIKCVEICNTDSSARTYSIYLDADGSGTADINTIRKDVSLAGNTGETLVVFWAIDNVNGTISVEGSVANKLSFTAFGYEES